MCSVCELAFRPITISELVDHSNIYNQSIIIIVITVGANQDTIDPSFQVPLSLHITICLIFRKREIGSIFIAKNPKLATKNPMLMKFTCMLNVTVVDVYTKN